MRVALLLWSFAPGGAERVAATLANEWVKTQQVSVFTIDNSTPDHYTLQNDVVRVRYERMKTTKSEAQRAPADPAMRIPRLLRPLAAIVKETRILVQLRRFLKEWEPELAVCFMTGMNNRALIASIGIDVRLIITEHIDPRQHPETGTARVLRRLFYKRADALVVSTESVARWAQDYVDPNRVEVIPNPIQQVEGVSEQERKAYVLGVGRLVPQKGFDVLIRAFADASADRQTWSLLLAGTGPERAILERLAEDLGIHDRVAFLGTVRNVEHLYRSASIFVLSSRYEGFGNVLVEAMAHGVACISTDCPSGPAEILTHGEDGLLVPVENPEVLSREIRGLMDDASMRIALGKAAKESARRFTPSRISMRWLQLFESLADRQG